MPKIVKRLTDKEISNAKPKGKDYRLYDGEGLCLLVRISGTKVWQYPYKFQGKNTIHTIGHYLKDGVAGHVGVADARAARYEIRKQLDQGIDPNEHKKERIHGAEGKDETTFEALGREWHSKGTWVTLNRAMDLLMLRERNFKLSCMLKCFKMTRILIVFLTEIKSCVI